MGVFKSAVPVLIVVFASVVLWVASVIYLSYSSVELRGELLGSENVYKFLSTGMLDEVKITAHKEDHLPEGVSVDLLEKIDPYFTKVGLEDVLGKTKENLRVAPEEFHKLKNDAVIVSKD
jgi:hypothetical protein